ncbi:MULTISPECIES: type III secretion protein HrpX [Ralstonia solanacearum species complex]|uniref:Type III secretion protein HrpX n=1 Tax=Ralstonia solanacearum K60 TaxID=1091042 RepID=A0AAP7ZJ30_RALSL|nr:type III secretion protein HrpX [Ralstonia solanacearum]OYQ09546.1 type III secretion protein HrpX [Ralstonia solanacearum K60]
MFDRFTPDIIETFNGIQAFAKQEGSKDFGPMRKAVATLRETADDFSQRAFRAANPADREQLRTLAQGFGAASDVCNGLITS